MTRDRSEEALDWARRIADPDFADWDAHVVWLEADPANARAFDDAMLLVDRATVVLETRTQSAALPINDNDAPPARPHRRGWGIMAGAAAAASLIAVVAFRPGGRSIDAREVASTGPGETRELMLADGSRIALNGSTTVTVNRADPRTVALMRGEAFFTVAHAAGRFTVAVGDAVVQDIGTEFDITHDDRSTVVAVRSGAVLYNPGRDDVRLGGGETMRVEGDQARIERSDPATAGGWRHGRLAYRDAPLDRIAADLSRSTGASVVVDRTLASRRFTGVIAVDRSDRNMLARIAQVLDVALHRDRGAWRMDMPRQ